MNLQELENLLKSSNNKVNVLMDNVFTCEGMTDNYLYDLVNNYFSDEEVIQLLEVDFFKEMNPLGKVRLMGCISEESKRIDTFFKNIKPEESTENINSFFIQGLSEDSKIKIFQNRNFVDNYPLGNIDVIQYIREFRSENKVKILRNKDLIDNKWKFVRTELGDIILEIEDEKDQLEMVDQYHLNHDKSLMMPILKQLSYKRKQEILIQQAEKYDLDISDIKEVISCMEIDEIGEFFRDNADFCTLKGIKVYEIINGLNTDRQLEFVEKMPQLGLTNREEKEIIMVLNKEARDKMDKSKLSQEQQDVLKMEIGEDGKIVLDLQKDLEIYRGLDRFIMPNAMQMTKEQRKKLIQLCDICPEMQVIDNQYGKTTETTTRDGIKIIDNGSTPSTAEEYKIGETWIQETLEGIKSEWGDLEKIAYIRNAIGKRISYSPDFEAEIFNIEDSRALWKMIASQKGTCLGISQLETYMLKEIGIKAEIMKSKWHAFVKLKDVEIPTNQGVIKGDTIDDTTWDLSTERYGAMPNNFCKSYKEIREHDIEDEGKDSEFHKVDESLSDVTLSLEEKYIRQIYTTIGICNEKGEFPIKKLMDISKQIDNLKISDRESIERQFQLLAKMYPEFATCQFETINILQNVLLNNPNLQFERCVINRVYNREDAEKKPVMYVYVDLPEEGKIFYCADETKKKMIPLKQQEFEEKFECYETDLKAEEGIRPWEKQGQETNKYNMQEMIAGEGR